MNTKRGRAIFQWCLSRYLPLAPERRPSGCCARSLGGEQGARLAEETFSGSWAAGGAPCISETQWPFDAVDQASLLGWSHSSTCCSAGPASCTCSLFRTRLPSSWLSCRFFWANFFLFTSHAFLRMSKSKILPSKVFSPHTECLGLPTWNPYSRRKTWLLVDFLFPEQVCSLEGHPFLKKKDNVAFFSIYPLYHSSEEWTECHLEPALRFQVFLYWECIN